MEAKCAGCHVQGKLRIGLGEESVVSALAHAQLLHSEGGQDKDGALANRLERAVQSVKQAVSQCPSYEVLIPALLTYPLEVRHSPGPSGFPAKGSGQTDLQAVKRSGLVVRQSCVPSMPLHNAKQAPMGSLACGPFRMPGIP